MDPITAGIAMGGGQLLGGIAGAIGGASNNSAMLGFSREQMNLNEFNYNNRISSAVSDAARAGLNPIYAAGMAGSGSTGMPGTPNLQNAGAEIGHGISNSASSLASGTLDVKQKQENIRQTKAEADKAEEEATQAGIDTEIKSTAKSADLARAKLTGREGGLIPSLMGGMMNSAGRFKDAVGNDASKAWNSYQDWVGKNITPIKNNITNAFKGFGTPQWTGK